MGTDKAALIHPDGRTLARRAYDLLAGAGCAAVFLSLREGQEIPPGFSDLTTVRVVRDPAGTGQGPLAGMIAAMRSAPAADWLVLACDLPRLDPATLTRLTTAKLPNEMFLCYRSEFDGLPEPLCAFYGGGVLPVLEQAVAAGGCCPRKVLIRGGCRLLEPVAKRALDNTNTPQEWQTAVQS